MMVPFCKMCGETEVGTYTNSTEFCSEYCTDRAYEHVLDEGACDGCGTSGNFYDGLCYQCQCDAHADGTYDMDAEY